MRLTPISLVFVVLVLLAATGCAADTVTTAAAIAESGAERDQGVLDDDGHGDEPGDHAADEDADHGDEDEHGDEDRDEHGDEDDHDDHGDTAAGLGAHEHGAAELTVAWAGSDMAIDLISPNYNIFGFETEPDSDEEIALVADRTAALTAPGVLAINPEAECTVNEPAQTDVEFEAGHAEITVSWLLTCLHPEKITQLDAAQLFAEFPNLEDVDAQWASDAGQSAAELTPSAATLSLG